MAGDPATSPRAATRHTPADDADSLRDLLAEPLLLAALATQTLQVPPSPRGPVASYQRLTRPQIFEMVDAQIASAGLEASHSGFAGIVGFLQLLALVPNRNTAIDAECLLRLLGGNPSSLDAIGKKYGVVRATVHCRYRILQRWFADLGIDIRSRGDKSAATREACRRRRTGQRKPKKPWKGNHLWHHPLPLQR
jgi:biotin operon repressor